MCIFYAIWGIGVTVAVSAEPRSEIFNYSWSFAKISTSIGDNWAGILGDLPRYSKKAAADDQDIGALDGRQHVRAITSSIGSLCCGAESLLHKAGLLAVNNNLSDQSAELKEGGEYQSRGEPDGPIGRPPLARRLFLYALGLLGGFWVAFAGVQQLDGQRRIFGAALILIGVLGAVLGSGLFLATFAYPSTWGWWL